MRAFAVVSIAAASVLCTADHIAAADKGALREDEAFASTILKRKIRTSVYLPPSFEVTRRSESRFPVVYLLHGLGDNHRAWPRLGKIKPTLDQLIGAGKLRPVIVIMPGCGQQLVRQ